jgi:glutamate synthase domain-containing protein 3
MVEIERLEDDDAEACQALVAEHVAHTRSARGAEILASFAATRARFWKVVPKETKLAVRAAASGGRGT